MRFGPDVLDEIRARLPVSAVVARRVKLKKQGREWVGLSPFNKEKSPSFFVNDQKGFYHDFSSGKHGDVFTFLMETEGLSFPEAVERLAADAGVRLPERVDTPETREVREKRAGAMEALEIAARFFEERFASASGTQARAYAARRGLSEATLAEFRIGYAPGGRTALKDHLVGRGAAIEVALEAGLLIAPEDGGAPYDRFRDRLMIPIHDGRGRVVGFGGRALAPDAKPKYLNSPETALFRKSELLFNAHRAREAAHRQRRLVLVEGYMDAIALWQAGLQPVVAALGTAFNENHVENAWRLAPEPVICFDGDRAGIGAAHRSLERILPVLKDGYSFWYAFVPDALDPDDFVRANGIEAFRALVGRARPIVDVLWDREVERFPIDTPERKAGLERRLREAIAEIKDAGVRRLYEQHFRMRLGSAFYRLDRDRFRPGETGRRGGPATAPLTRPAPVPQLGTEYALLGLLLAHPHLARLNEEVLLERCMLGERLDAFKAAIAEAASEGDEAPADLVARLSDAHPEAVDACYGLPDPRRGLAAGHRLAERLPVLKLDPPPDFLDRLIELLFARIESRRMEEDLESTRELYVAAFDAEAEARFLAPKRETERAELRLRRLETELDEWARGLRGAAQSGTRLAETLDP